MQPRFQRKIRALFWRASPVVLLCCFTPPYLTSESALTDTLSANTPLYTSTQMPSGKLASALNSRGDVAGNTSYSPGAGNRPVVWSQGDANSAEVAVMKADEFSSVCDINDAGQVAGAFNSEVAILPFLWSAGGVQELPLPGGASGGEACGINQIGEMVGYSSGEKGLQAVVWREGKAPQELAPLPGDSFSTARRINDSGQVAGTSGSGNNRQAVVWSKNGVVQRLGTLPGDSSSEATGISLAGEVVGYSEGPKGTRAFLWSGEKGMQDLGLLPNGIEAQALAMNDSGIVVGTCNVGGESRAFVWTAEAGMQDLNEQISSDLAVALVGAHAINNKGQILTTAADAVACSDGSGACPMDECAPAPKYSFLLTPSTAP